MAGFFLRWAFAFVLLAATYNPTRFNYVAWARENGSETLSLVVLFGLVLFVGYIIYLRATLRSIGPIGMGLVLAVVAAVLWVLWDIGWINFTNPTANTWIGLFAMSLVLGIGLSWSIIRRRLSGQVDIDDVEE